MILPQRNTDELEMALLPLAGTDDSGLIRSKSYLADCIAGTHLAGLEGFNGFNPCLPASTTQGTLECIHELQLMSCSITGLDAASLAALSGSQAAFACLSMIKKYHQGNRSSRYSVLLCADMPHIIQAARDAGLDVKQTGINQLTEKLGADVAAIILPVPGPGEDDLEDSLIRRIRELDVLVYREGSGQYYIPAQPGAGHFTGDLINLDLGHLCGIRPGLNAILSNEKLKAFLPVPAIQQGDSQYRLQTLQQNPYSIGALTAGAGNVESMLRCYVQLRLKGVSGICQQALKAVVSALYLIKKLADSGMGRACFSPQSSGQCCIRLSEVEPLMVLQDLCAEDFPALQVRIDKPAKEDTSGMLLTLGQLHYLSRARLDVLAEHIVKQLQQISITQD